MTENNQDWVRGVEDFKIGHEKEAQIKDLTTSSIADFSMTAAYPTAPVLVDWESIDREVTRGNAAAAIQDQAKRLHLMEQQSQIIDDLNS